VIRLQQLPRLLVDCSSTDVVLTRELAAKSEQRGLPYLDAPVSGGPEGAAAATLSFLAGGKVETLAAAKPILAALGKKIVHFGPAGMGQLAKACHNLIVSIEVMAICEGFAVAEANGLDSKLFYELCMNAAAKSWAMQYRCPVPQASPDSPSNREYAAGGSAAVVVKDLGIALSVAKSAGLSPELGPLALKAYRTLVDQNLGHLDLSAIYMAMRPKSTGTSHELQEAGRAQ
jgi:3-hydroxyisobutyrate dehydrogenase